MPAEDERSRALKLRRNVAVEANGFFVFWPPMAAPDSPRADWATANHVVGEGLA